MCARFNSWSKFRKRVSWPFNLVRMSLWLILKFYSHPSFGIFGTVSAIKTERTSMCNIFDRVEVRVCDRASNQVINALNILESMIIVWLCIEQQILVPNAFCEDIAISMFLWSGQGILWCQDFPPFYKNPDYSLIFSLVRFAFMIRSDAILVVKLNRISFGEE